MHPPAVRDCIKCHDPHTSDNKNQLLKATSGDKGKNLCLDCHKQGLNVPEKGSRHAALEMGCDTCHTTHKTGDAGKAESQGGRHQVGGGRQAWKTTNFSRRFL